MFKIRAQLALVIAVSCILTCCDDCEKKKDPVTGDIKIADGYPKSKALTITRGEGEAKITVPIASVNATWAVEAPCPCDKLQFRQEIKGSIDVVGTDGAKSSMSAKTLVEKTMSSGGVPDTEGTEAYDVRHPSSGKDDSNTEFIHDVGKNGSSTYPATQVNCKKLDDKKSLAEIFDEPGVNSVVGPQAGLYKEFNIRLTYRTIVLCNKKEIGSFIWHIKYDLPEDASRPKEVGLGELK